MRAALMGGLFVWAIALDRRSTALVSLAAACWAMTLVNPLTLWDVGFQLSSAATAGLIIFSPGITAAFSRLVPGFGGPLMSTPGSSAPSVRATLPEDVIPSPLQGALDHTRSMARGLLEDGLLITMAANVTTLPLVVFYFGRLSVVSLLTNLLIAPVQPYIMMWGSAGVLAGAAGLAWLAQALLWIPWLSLVWTVAMVRWTAALPGASLDISNYGLGALVLTYTLLFGFHWRKTLRMNAARLANVAAARRLAAADRPDDGHGAGRADDPRLATGAYPAGWPPPRPLSRHRPGRRHPDYHAIRKAGADRRRGRAGASADRARRGHALLGSLIDLLLLTHPDADHMAAQIGIPARFQVDYALDTPLGQANADAQGWRDALARTGATVQLQEAGGWVDLGDGVALWVLWPPPGGMEHEHADNENSLVVKLVYGDFSVLLTGDAGLPSERAWLHAAAPVQATVLKVGHHGSKSATGADFVAAVAPTLAVIQVGADNSYGHPADEVLDNLNGIPVLRSDRHGRVHIASDGRQMWVATAREAPAW